MILSHKVILITALFLFSKQAFGQNMDSLNYKKNCVYLEGFGNAGLISGYSINYEIKIAKMRNGFVSFRTGFAHDFDEGQYFIFPLLINRIINRQGNNNLEVGAGTVLYFFKYKNGQIKSDEFYNPGATGVIMYRYQKPRGGFVFRIGWTPNVFFRNTTFLTSVAYLLTVGTSIGYAF